MASLSAFLKWTLLYATSLSMVATLSIGQNQTSKPRQTKFSSSTTEPGTGSLVTPLSTASKEKDDSGLSIYRLTNSNGATCILMKTDGVVEVNFLLYKNEEQVDSFIPDPENEKVTVSGDCRDGDGSFLTIAWPGYQLVINFKKAPGGDRWYIQTVAVTVDTDLSHFHNIKTNGQYIKLYHRDAILQTPVGRSYACPEVNIDLKPDDSDNPPPGLRGSLLLRLLKLQPFMYKNDDFETSYDCKAQRAFRDETAPIAVGSTLAAAVLMTVTGYGVFRYFKVNNVKYNTME